MSSQGFDWAHVGPFWVHGGSFWIKMEVMVHHAGSHGSSLTIVGPLGISWKAPGATMGPPKVTIHIRWEIFGGWGVPGRGRGGLNPSQLGGRFSVLGTLPPSKRHSSLSFIWPIYDISMGDTVSHGYSTPKYLGPKPPAKFLWRKNIESVVSCINPE